MSPLEELIRQQATATLTDTMRQAVHEITFEIAKELLREPQFREALRAQVVEWSRRVLADLQHSSNGTASPEV